VAVGVTGRAPASLATGAAVSQVEHKHNLTSSAARLCLAAELMSDCRNRPWRRVNFAIAFWKEGDLSKVAGLCIKYRRRVLQKAEVVYEC